MQHSQQPGQAGDTSAAIERVLEGEAGQEDAEFVLGNAVYRSQCASAS